MVYGCYSEARYLKVDHLQEEPRLFTIFISCVISYVGTMAISMLFRFPAATLFRPGDNIGPFVLINGCPVFIYLLATVVLRRSPGMWFTGLFYVGAHGETLSVIRMAVRAIVSVPLAIAAPISGVVRVSLGPARGLGDFICGTRIVAIRPTSTMRGFDILAIGENKNEKGPE
jgi:uncharacterized RDD family membrane protein YckC